MGSGELKRFTPWIRLALIPAFGPCDAQPIGKVSASQESDRGSVRRPCSSEQQCLGAAFMFGEIVHELHQCNGCTIITYAYDQAL
jgi:hypothetical protein